MLVPKGEVVIVWLLGYWQSVVSSTNQSQDI